MPKRVIDFDAMWGSDKLAACAEWAQAEYAWFYGLADASGCFEVTNLRVIWGRVAAIRRNLTIERLEQIFDEFRDKGLLFVWEHEGKRYGHWTGSDVPGRLPAPSWRMRLERLAPPVPKELFEEYVSRFARGRATMSGGFAAGSSATKSDTAIVGAQFENRSVGRDRKVYEVRKSAGLSGLKGAVEQTHAQDWYSDLNRNSEMEEEQDSRAEPPVSVRQDAGKTVSQFHNPNSPVTASSKASCRLNSSASSDLESETTLGRDADPDANRSENTERWQPAAVANEGAGILSSQQQRRDKSFFVAKELRVGLGPSCGPIKVKAEALERMRARSAAREGSRSP